MVKLLYSPKAKDDLNNIFDFIAVDNLEKAIDFTKYLQAEIEKLGHFPLLGTNQGKLFLIRKNVRFLICREYLVFYRYDKTNDTIHILRILNGAVNYPKEPLD